MRPVDNGDPVRSDCLFVCLIVCLCVGPLFRGCEICWELRVSPGKTWDVVRVINENAHNHIVVHLVGTGFCQYLLF